MRNIQVALAVIIENDKILLTQRFDPSNPTMHMKWQLPGGGVEKDETIANACIREAREETGLTIQLATNKFQKISKQYSTDIYHLHGFLARPISDTIDVSKDEETNDAKWLTREEVEKLECVDETKEMIDLSIKYYASRTDKHKE